MSKPLLLFVGPVASRSGYGSHARDIVRSLINIDKFDIKIIPIRWGITPLNALVKGIDDDILNLIIKDNKLNKKPDISIQLTVPNEFNNENANYNIGITAGIETTACSLKWVEGVNRVDLCIVPSSFSKNVFINTNYINKQNNAELKINKPIEVLFEGYNKNIYYKTNTINKSVDSKLKNINEDFLFLFVGHWLNGDLGHDRKDVGMLIKVFLETFKNRKNKPALLLKTGSVFSKIEKQQIEEKINFIKSQSKGDLPNIYLLYGDLTDDEMNSLYNHKKVKVNISFTKGEGFCRPLLEASIIGKPIIVSSFGGQLDFLNNDNSILLPGELKNIHQSVVWNEVLIPDSKWFYVNYTIASNEMLRVFNNYDLYLEKSQKLSNINTKFEMNNMTKQLELILDKYLNNIKIEEKFIMPSIPKLKKIGGLKDESN